MPRRSISPATGKNPTGHVPSMSRRRLARRTRPVFALPIRNVALGRHFHAQPTAYLLDDRLGRNTAHAGIGSVQAGFIAVHRTGTARHIELHRQGRVLPETVKSRERMRRPQTDTTGTPTSDDMCNAEESMLTIRSRFEISSISSPRRTRPIAETTFSRSAATLSA